MLPQTKQALALLQAFGLRLDAGRPVTDEEEESTMTTEQQQHQREMVARRIRMGYPRRDENGDIIIDEKCKCGGMRSEHEDTISLGHGPMPSRGCGKFTWIGWVHADPSI